ncbi:hypothetical protein [Desulfolucanica intricata]|uniref:hypothetical protein n=1 Tax=Desulfolucanica intricata TaxID=1285191 RepID=UPI0008331947|nr:hypothetical protein [Desulfolucanica intricata]
MLRYLKSQEGMALLAIIIIMAVIMVIFSVLFNMVTRERIMTNKYEDKKQAYYIAEAAADLAVNTFIQFINSLHDDQTYVDDEININDPGDYENSFYKRLVEGSGIVELEENFRDTLGTEDLSIDYTSFLVNTDGEHNVPAKILKDADSFDTLNTLTIKIEAAYRGEVYPYEVKLRYCKHGDVYEYKGQGEW